jgi:hypothetical protein
VKSLSTYLLVSMVLSMVIGAETAHAYSNVVAGTKTEPSAERIFRSARTGDVKESMFDLSPGMPFHRSQQPPRDRWW